MAGVGTPAICVLLLLAAAASVVSGFTPVTYPATVSSECDQYDLLQDQQLMETLRQAIQQQLGPPGCNPPKNRSCQEIIYCFPSAPSGYYQITASNGSLVQVYCDMEGTNCGGEGGWTRIALVNMTAPNASCPSGLNQSDFSGRTLCHHSSTGCQSAIFSAFNLNYCEVCGRVIGYQFGTPEAFSRSIVITSLTIDSQYLDGVSITHGSGPRTHIWSYPAGVTTTRTDRFGCPCNTGSTVTAPPYIGGNYYCESATTSISSGTFYPDDVLWDGQQCILVLKVPAV